MVARCWGGCVRLMPIGGPLWSPWKPAHLQNTGCFIPLFCTISFVDSCAFSLRRSPGSYRLGALFECVRLLGSLHSPQQASVVLKGSSDGWVIRLKHFLSNRQ